MHFPIIVIEDIDVPKEAFITKLDYDDRTLCENTDYYGDIHEKKVRKTIISSDWLEDFLDGIATIDVKNETITFLDKETIKENFQNYLLEAAKALCRKGREKKLSVFDFWTASRRYKDYPVLFYWGHGLTSLDFVDDAALHAGKTFKIGNIFDAHF